MKLNIPLCLDIYSQIFGGLSEDQINGFKEILSNIHNDTHISNPQWVAYMLATTWHETAFTMKPIDEYGSTNYFEKRYGYQTTSGRNLGNNKPGDGSRYHGRGYVQLTGRYNYNRVGRELGLDLINHPDSVKEPLIAYNILAGGMIQGWFTGKSLSDYINSAQCDYINARKIINGTDKAKTIASYAKKFEAPLL